MCVWYLTMNKAFVREPDDPDPRCPRCELLGRSVARITLAAHLPPEAVPLLSDAAYYCANPRCPVAYFDASGTEVGVELLHNPAYPKDPAAPVCRCFNIMAEEIERDARAGDAARVKELIAKSRSPQARCAELSPSGQCCLPEVQKLFLKSRTGKR